MTFAVSAASRVKEKEPAMNLSEQFNQDVATAAPETTIGEVVARMRERNVGAVVVIQKRKVVGIVTDRDVALALGGGQATVDQPVSEVMTRKVRTIWDDQGVFNATQYFFGHKVRRLPIINRDDELVGIVTLDDVLYLLCRELFNVSRALDPALGAGQSILTEHTYVPAR
jgi:CBS domain-containing protein